MKRTWDFQVEMTHGRKDHNIIVSGSVTPGYPATGPTYDCGGTPEEPACIEDAIISLVHTRKDGTTRTRVLQDKSGKLFDALEDEIWEMLDQENSDD